MIVNNLLILVFFEIDLAHLSYMQVEALAYWHLTVKSHNIGRDELHVVVIFEVSLITMSPPL